MRGVVGLALIVLILCIVAYAADSREETITERCLQSVAKYMTTDEADAFCSQPTACRKWWDDLSEAEQEELQPPKVRNNQEWWTHCHLENNQAQK